MTNPAEMGESQQLSRSPEIDELTETPLMAAERAVRRYAKKHKKHWDRRSDFQLHQDNPEYLEKNARKIRKVANKMLSAANEYYNLGGEVSWLNDATQMELDMTKQPLLPPALKEQGQAIKLPQRSTTISPSHEPWPMTY